MTTLHISKVARTSTGVLRALITYNNTLADQGLCDHLTWIKETERFDGVKYRLYGEDGKWIKTGSLNAIIADTAARICSTVDKHLIHNDAMQYLNALKNTSNKPMFSAYRTREKRSTDNHWLDSRRIDPRINMS